MTETEIANLLSDGRRQHNWHILNRARAELLQQADAAIREALQESRSLTDDEHARIASALEKAGDIQREAAGMYEAFVTAASHAHLVGGNQFSTS